MATRPRWPRARPEPEEGQLPGFDEEEPLRFAAFAGGEQVLAGEADGGFAELLDRLGRPAGGGARLEGRSPPRRTRRWRRRSQHDTLVAAYLIDPARRGYPLRELAEELGLGAEVNGGEDRWPSEAVLTRALAERQRAELEELGLMRLLDEVELPLVDVLVEMEREGVKLDVQQVRTIAKRVDEQAQQLEREIWELAGEEFTIGSPQQLGVILFEKLGPVEEAARQDRLLDRRARAPGDPRTSTRSSPRSSSGAS